MNLYHVSPETNTYSIKHQGVDPYKARGKRWVSWWVEWDAILWAIAHVSARHKVSVDLIRVWALSEQQSIGDFKNTRWKGVYTYDNVLVPADSHRAKDVVEALKPDEPDDLEELPF